MLAPYHNIGRATKQNSVKSLIEGGVTGRYTISINGVYFTAVIIGGSFSGNYFWCYVSFIFCGSKKKEYDPIFGLIKGRYHNRDIFTYDELLQIIDQNVIVKLKKITKDNFRNFI